MAGLNTQGFSGAQYAAMSKKSAPTNVKNIGARTGLSRGEATATSQKVTNPVTSPPPANNPPTNPPVYDGSPVATASSALSAPDTSVETLTKTPEYLARERAIQAAMGAFTAGQATDLTRYNEDYGKSLQDLGYDANTGFDKGALMSSGQRATTSGRAYNAMGDDFAGRGMLQSGAYQAKQGVLGTQLEDQRQAIDKGKTRFAEDQNKALLAQQAANEQQRQAALEAARQSILNSMGM